jgi:hypothetical protein
MQLAKRKCATVPWDLTKPRKGPKFGSVEPNFKRDTGIEPSPTGWSQERVGSTYRVESVALGLSWREFVPKMFRKRAGEHSVQPLTFGSRLGLD